MKVFHSICSVLLLVPLGELDFDWLLSSNFEVQSASNIFEPKRILSLANITVLARLPPSIRSKVIYHQDHFLAETRDGFFDFDRHPGYTAYFKFSREIVSIDLFSSRKDPKLGSFVVETLGTPWPNDPNKSQDCRFQCSESIKVVEYCQGNARVREMTEEERRQIQAFIDEPQG